MAMNKTTLGAALASAVTSLSADDKNDPVKIWTVVADELIKHVTANARVAVPAAGLMAPNGTCTGSATGTIS